MLKRLSAAFAKREKLYINLAVVLILGFMFTMALCSSVGAFGDPGDSAIVDEIAHIPAGYTYDKDHDYRLNPEHPPLAKALAGLPLALDKNIKGPEANWSWDGINQWDSGWYMLYQAGNNPNTILLLSRLPMMLLMIGLGLFLYKWMKELFGWKVGLIGLLMFAFYPDVLAHGRLVTTDVAAAFGFVVATYYFDKAIKAKTWKWIIIGALALALAQLLKFSAFLLFAIFFLLVIVRAVMDRRDKGFWPAFWANFKPFFWISAISVIFVWMVYLPFVWKTPPLIEHQLIETNLTSDPRTLPLRNFEHKFENNPILRGLGHYTLGIMLVIGRVEGGNNTFILGHLSDKSISWYFPVAWLLKTPVSVILLAFWSLIALIINWPKETEKKWNLAVILMPIIVYWAFTLKGQLNIGIRHLMPTVPFVLLLIAYTLNPIVNGTKKRLKIIVGILILYMIGSTLYNYPNFIAYFNEFTPKAERYKRLDDSSLDWGQDLYRLKKYIDDNKITSMKVDYFGGSVPSYFIPEAVEWHSSYGPTTGWLAVSSTFYQSSKLTGSKEGTWSYGWLDKMDPTAEIGGSILVFHIPADYFQKNPPISPYKIIKVDHPTATADTVRRVGI